MKRQPKVEIYEAGDGWRWRLVAGNGRIQATGEAHTRRRDADRAAKGAAETFQRIANRELIERIKAGKGG